MKESIKIKEEFDRAKKALFKKKLTIKNSLLKFLERQIFPVPLFQPEVLVEESLLLFPILM